MELLLVLALILLLSVIAFPSIEAMYADMKVKAAADHLSARFSLARAQAIEDGRTYRFAVQPGSGEYRLAPDDPGFWNGDQGNPAPVADNSTPPLVVEDKLPGDILFNLGPGTTPSVASTPDSGGWVTILLFDSKGGCSDDRNITLSLEGAAPIEISIRGLTGTVTTRQGAAGGSK